MFFEVIQHMQSIFLGGGGWGQYCDCMLCECSQWESPWMDTHTVTYYL